MLILNFYHQIDASCYWYSILVVNLDFGLELKIEIDLCITNNTDRVIKQCKLKPTHRLQFRHQITKLQMFHLYPKLRYQNSSLARF
jgi:hypothetical protein